MQHTTAYAGPAAALNGEGFTQITRERVGQEIRVRYARARTMVLLTIPLGSPRWTATVTTTAAGTPLTIEADMGALVDRVGLPRLD